MKYKDVIGVVGGMGSFATLSFFERLLYAFPAEKEWDRPRIIIDNRCTMPSRVRGVLYNENKEIIIKELSDSLKGLIFQGATKIIFICNTAHVFLDEVFKIVPEAKNITINIIDSLANEMKNNQVSQAYLIATEGTILSNIYRSFFDKFKFLLYTPENEKLELIRFFIEQVKTMQINAKIKSDFDEFIESIPYDNIILGCTELPILYKKTDYSQKIIWDPLESAINRLKCEIM